MHVLFFPFGKMLEKYLGSFDSGDFSIIFISEFLFNFSVALIVCNPVTSHLSFT